MQAENLSIENRLLTLVSRFQENLAYYKDNQNSYNEHQCRIEYIDVLLKLLGWDVSNERGLPPQYREVIGENYSNQSDRPDYTLTLRGLPKIFVEAKKPSVDILHDCAPALQCRKYGWNAKHRISILTNFEYFVIYDTTYVPKEGDKSSFARLRVFHYTEYVNKICEMTSLISRDVVYSGEFERKFNIDFSFEGNQKKQVDTLFLTQINEWRVKLSNELYTKSNKYQSIEMLNDTVQSFINKIIFLRICEDKNLPVYYKLHETIKDLSQLNIKLEELFRVADKKYNSGLFLSETIIFDLNSEVISDMIKGLYYPQSPYMFNIIEPNLLGGIYELFLTEQLHVNENDNVILLPKKDCIDRSVVTTPTEIVKYMVEKTLSKLCTGKSPDEILDLRIADIACGSGIYLEEVFSYLQESCTNWYMEHDKAHLIEISNGKFKLPLEEKKKILANCVYGIDIDIHAVEVAKFSLLIKLIENENSASVSGIIPILPDLSNNIIYGNSLISAKDIENKEISECDLVAMAPLDWESNFERRFDIIIGNPPYVHTEDLHGLVPKTEFELYKAKYQSVYKQFDKYFLFVEQAMNKISHAGYVCYIVPNKFFKIKSGEKLRQLIAERKNLVSLDDFGDTQLFENKTTYSSIILLQNKCQTEFKYSTINSLEDLWLGQNIDYINLSQIALTKSPWKLTNDIEILKILKQLENIAVPLSKHANIFNGIQTSAERPTPVYWFSKKEIQSEDDIHFIILRDNINFKIEKSILKPYFKPTKVTEKGLYSYSKLHTDKYIIFPYDSNGKLIPIDNLKSNYSGVYEFLNHYYDRLVPKSISPKGIRDVPNATEETWYQYGRTQALTAFSNTPKLIVGILSKKPMYAYDKEDMLIASGGTAGYCAISRKYASPYELEYIQAWLSHPITERISRLLGSNFEGGYISRGTSTLETIPFIELDLNIEEQKNIHDTVVKLSHEIYSINEKLNSNLLRKTSIVQERKKKRNIKKIEQLIQEVYELIKVD